MKKITTIVIFICLALTIKYAYTYTYKNTLQSTCYPPRLPLNPPLTTATPEGIGTVEKPFARAEYERNRFKNPKTGVIPRGIRAKELAFAQKLPHKHTKADEQEWHPRGPFNVGGRTRAFAIDNLNPNLFFAGGITGGLYKSEDAGASFIRVTPPDQLQSVTAIVQNPLFNKQDTWYYGTGENYGVIGHTSFSNQTAGNGIFKSTDHGETWEQLPSTKSHSPHIFRDGMFDVVWKLAIHPFQGHLYAALYGGIVRSKDEGETWEVVLGFDNEQTPAEFSEITIAPNGVMFAAISQIVSGNGTQGYYLSTDGERWSPITPQDFPTTVRRTVIAYDPCQPTNAYFFSETPNNGVQGHQLWHFTFVGNKWEERTANIPNSTCIGGVSGEFNFSAYNSQNSYDMCIMVHPLACDVILLGGTNVYRSTDAFTSVENTKWIGGYQCDQENTFNYTYPNHHSDQHVFAFDPFNSDVMYTANDGGVYRTNNIMEDSVHWESLNNGYLTTQFYTAAIEPGEATNAIIVGGMQDNGTFMTNNIAVNQTWTRSFFGDGAFCAIAKGRDYYYVATQQGRTFQLKIDDDGNVLGATRIDPSGASEYIFISPFNLDPNNNEVMYLAAGRSIWRNHQLSGIPFEDGAERTIDTNWERLQVTQLNNTDIAIRITCLTPSQSDPNTLYFGDNNGRVYRIDQVNAPDSTLNRIEISPEPIPQSVWTSNIALDEEDPNAVLVTFANYGIRSLFYSTNKGETWTDVSGNLEENEDGTGNGPSVIWAHIHRYQGEATYYVGTSIGLFSTKTLNGRNTVWAIEGVHSIGYTPINMITSRSFDNTIVVASHGNGMFSTIPEVTSTQTRALVTKGFTLEQNSPNPFSDQTKIRFHLAKSAHIDLSIYDLAGRKVHSLAAGKLVPGRHKVYWNGTDAGGAVLANGMYLVVLTDGTHKVSKQMMLAK